MFGGPEIADGAGDGWWWQCVAIGARRSVALRSDDPDRILKSARGPDFGVGLGEGAHQNPELGRGGWIDRNPGGGSSPPAARHEQEAATLDGDGAIAEVAGIAENIEDVEREIFEPGCRYGDFDRSLAQVDCASVVSAIDENFPNPALFTRMSSMPNHVCIRSASADHACLRLCWKSGQGVKLIPTQGMDGNEDDEKALQRSAMLYRQRPSLTQITVHPCWSPRCWRRISAAGS